MSSARSGIDDPVVVVVDGELDASDIDWTDELRRLVTAGHRHVVVDMLGVSFVDSSVVRELVDTFRALAGTGWLRVVYTHHLIRRVIAICGLADALPQYTSVDAALRGAPSALRPDDTHGYRELEADDPADADPAHRGGARAVTDIEVSRHFAADLRTVRSGRHYVRDVMLDWDLEQLADDAQLCVSEIVTNAVRHAGTEVTITVRREGAEIVVEVHDGMPELTSRPSAEPVPETSPGGRGLHIVAAVSQAWGIRAAEGGKVIWFRLPVPRSGRQDEDADIMSIFKNQTTAHETAPESEHQPGYGRALGTG